MESFAYDISEALRACALALPEATEGTSCVNRAFKVREKNFLFVGEKDNSVKVMVRLKDSLEQARAMNDPRVDVGKVGWVTCRFAPDDALETALLEAWVIESFRTVGPKTLVRQLD